MSFSIKNPADAGSTLSDLGAHAGNLSANLAVSAQQAEYVSQQIYPVDRRTNWYQKQPYAFRYGSATFFLPINPSGISVTTHFATGMVTTLYSVVEEHSEVRYYDITIEGTTGIAPEHIQIEGAPKNIPSKTGRQSFSTQFDIAGAVGGFFSKTLNMVQNTLNKASELVDTFAGSKNKSGVFLDNSGYVAFHNFYRFLLAHKAICSGQYAPKQVVPMWFLNYKDDVAYNCVIQRFVLKRSAESPLLYNYSIQLRAYNLQAITKISSDIKLSNENDKAKLLGLDSAKSESAFAKMKKASGLAKGVVGGITGGISVLGS